jgi:hypothetical protein
MRAILKVARRYNKQGSGKEDKRTRTHTHREKCGQKKRESFEKREEGE